MAKKKVITKKTVVKEATDEKLKVTKGTTIVTGQDINPMKDIPDPVKKAIGEQFENPQPKLEPHKGAKEGSSPWKPITYSWNKSEASAIWTHAMEIGRPHQPWGIILRTIVHRAAGGVSVDQIAVQGRKLVQDPSDKDLYNIL